ncbi:hypothetical protein HK105_200606 [Polyrhizophydium stewartii]|uniref:Protein kintoun n=1 Tax=Polyrhizophydium stewartii TaxID=2732419 RepID=A0ABR4NJL0_9FUNG
MQAGDTKITPETLTCAAERGDRMQELKRFQDSFKNAEFRKLFFDYMEEIQDPANRERNERELAQLEAERGVDVRFVKPTASYVLKTRAADGAKAFINMCSSPELAQAEPDSKQPTAPAGSAAGSTRGQNWRIPYSLAPPRDDVDHAKKPCKVYDCVFHPETLRFGASRPAFANLLAITAIEGIERQFGVKLDRDFKTIKMKSKGTPSTTIIRTTKENFVKPDRETSIEFIERIKQEQGRAEASPEASANSSLLATPKYTIVHQQLFSDYQRFTSERERDQTSRPDAILIKISLPGVAIARKQDSAAEADLDVSPSALDLVVAKKYSLHIDLPFPVFDQKGSAKFDKAKSILSVSLPVVPPPRQLQHKPLISSAAEPPSAESHSDNDEDSPTALSFEKTDLIQELDTAETAEMAAAPETAESSEPAAAGADQPDSAAASNLPSTGVEELQDALEKKLRISDIPTRIPPFHITQSPTHATIVVDVPDILKASADVVLSLREIILAFADASECRWRLCLRPEHQIDPEHSVALDISADNAVLIVRKSSRGIWGSIGVVASDGQVETRMLPTIEAMPHPHETDALEPPAGIAEVRGQRKADQALIAVVHTPTTQASAAAATSEPAALQTPATPPPQAPQQTTVPAITLSNQLLYDMD